MVLINYPGGMTLWSEGGANRRFICWVFYQIDENSSKIAIGWKDDMIQGLLIIIQHILNPSCMS